MTKRIIGRGCIAIFFTIAIWFTTNTIVQRSATDETSVAIEQINSPKQNTKIRTHLTNNYAGTASMLASLTIVGIWGYVIYRSIKDVIRETK